VVPTLEAWSREISEGCEPKFLQTLVQPRTALRSDKYDRIVVGVLFEESRMFDLLVA
jgi:hypothetical protein